MTASTRTQRLAPWIEGAVLALLVLAVFTFGGEAVRASYHGYLKTSMGEAVLRDGLLPENPHHAGTVPRHYTLFPLLAVLLGRIGPGPLWAFAALNVLSAVLFGPALDALGRAFELSFRARRAAFLAAVLGFNGLGWLGFLVADGEPFGRPPVFVLMPMTLAQEAFGWDGRLQCFLTKYFNVSSHTMTLPFALWSLAVCVPRVGLPARPWKATLPAAVMLTMNPLIGAVVGLCMLFWLAPAFRKAAWRERGVWIASAGVALALAVPFLLPALSAAPTGPDLSGEPALGGHPLSNLIGPLFLLLVPGVLGAIGMRPGLRWRYFFAAAVMAAFVVFVSAPEASEYKLSRMGGLLWAIPAGAWCADALARPGMLRFVPASLLLACLPTTLIAAWAYLAWGRASPALPLRVEHGRLAVDERSVRYPLTHVILEAEAGFEPRAVVLMHPHHPGTAAENGLVQGNALAPVLHHPLFVDLPQIHNERIEDLGLRLDLAIALWEEHGWSQERREMHLARADALAQIRAQLPTRPMLVISHDSATQVSAVLVAVGGSALARDGGFTLWSLPAVDAGGL